MITARRRSPGSPAVARYTAGPVGSPAGRGPAAPPPTRVPLALKVVLERLSRPIELLVLGAMFVGLPLAPLLMAALSGRLADATEYRRSCRLAFRHLTEMRRSGAVSRYVRWRARGGRASRLEPDERIEGSCTHCGQCCTNKSCVFVRFDALGRSSCRIYDTAFWRWLSCGNYPVSREDIEVYRCPSFRVIRIHAATRDAGPPTATGVR
jgi:hypothetical protein